MGALKPRLEWSKWSPAAKSGGDNEPVAWEVPASKDGGGAAEANFFNAFVMIEKCTNLIYNTNQVASIKVIV